MQLQIKAVAKGGKHLRGSDMKKHVSNTTTKRWYNQIDEGPQGNFARKVIGVYY